MRLAVVCSAHGFGHTARQLALAPALLARGHAVTLFSAADAVIAHRPVGLTVRRWVVDVGIVQRDSLHEDPEATQVIAEARCSEEAIDALAETLVSFDGAVVDIAPGALEASRRAGVPAVAVGNFDWSWIYRHYSPLHDLAERFAAWQAPHPAIALEPGPGLFGFREVHPGGVLGRSAPPARVVAPGEVGVLVCFGGFGLEDLDHRLPRLPGVRWILAPPLPRLERPDVCWAGNVPFPALVAGADLLYTKPGYGILVEAMLAGVPVVWEDRGAFPEAPALVAALRARGDRPAWPDLGEAITARLRDARPEPCPGDGGARLALGVEAALGER